MNHKLIIALGLGALIAISCSNSNQDKSAENNDVDTIVQPVEETKVIVKEVEKKDSVRVIAPAAIATKQVSDGTLNITKVKVVGSILNIEAVLDNPEKNSVNINFPSDNIYYIDDASAKKMSLLKDDSGKFMITPTNAEGKKLWYLGSDKMILISLKFAVPAPDSKSISLTLGDFGSFDALPVTR